MPSLSKTCFRYSTARVSLPGGLLVSIRSSAWKCWIVSASIARRWLAPAWRDAPASATQRGARATRVGRHDATEYHSDACSSMAVRPVYPGTLVRFACRSSRSTMSPSPSATCRCSTKSRFQVDAGERIADHRPQRHRQVDAAADPGGDLPPDSRHRAAAARRARRAAGAGRAAVGGSHRRRGGRRRPRRARRARRMAAPAPGRHGDVAPVAAARRDRRHAVGRMEAPRAAGARAGRPAGPAAARRADQSPRHRGDHLARIVPRRLPRRGDVRDARSRVPRAARDAHRRDRSRPADVVARRLRDLRAQERGVARQRGAAPTPSSTRRWPPRKCGCAAA